MQLKKGVSVNDDERLEHEADVMGVKALNLQTLAPASAPLMQPTPSGEVQRVKISNRIRTTIKKWVSATYEGDDVDREVEEVIAWFQNAEKLTDKDVNWAAEKNYKEFFSEKWLLKTDGLAELESAEFRNEETAEDGLEEKGEDPEDPFKKHNKLLKKLEVTKHKPDILAYKKEHNCGMVDAINVIARRVTEGKKIAAETERREEGFAAAKRDGDSYFEGCADLALKVWRLAYVTAIGGGSQNVTLGGSYDDDAITQAIDEWHKAPALSSASASASAAPAAKGVTNLHAFDIENKAAREKNPDPLRGWQADFISKWDGVDINVHVNAKKHSHQPKPKH